MQTQPGKPPLKKGLISKRPSGTTACAADMSPIRRIMEDRRSEPLGAQAPGFVSSDPIGKLSWSPCLGLDLHLTRGDQRALFPNDGKPQTSEVTHKAGGVFHRKSGGRSQHQKVVQVR